MGRQLMGEPEKADRYKSSGHLTETHDAAKRSKSSADADLIPGSRIRVGDGTIDPNTLPYVRGTRQHGTITREEYYEWRPPPVRRTISHTAFVRSCQNPNCGRQREHVTPDGNGGWISKPEPFPGGRCPPCAAYVKRKGTERPHVLVYAERVRRARKASREWWKEIGFPRQQEEHERSERGEILYWSSARDGFVTVERRCRNGHEHVQLDAEGRCPACRKSFYKTGRERPFDYEAFQRGVDDEADESDAREFMLEQFDTEPAGLSVDERAVFAYLTKDARSSRGLLSEDMEVLSWLTRPPEEHDEASDDNLDGGYGLDPGELGAA
jgi:hypothetical protein